MWVDLDFCEPLVLLPPTGIETVSLWVLLNFRLQDACSETMAPVSGRGHGLCLRAKGAFSGDVNAVSPVSCQHLGVSPLTGTIFPGPS